MHREYHPEVIILSVLFSILFLLRRMYNYPYFIYSTATMVKIRISEIQMSLNIYASGQRKLMEFCFAQTTQR